MAKTKNIPQLKNVWLKLLNKYKQNMNKTEIVMKLYKKQKNYLTKGTKQLTNTTNITQLTRVSSELLNKYKNDLSKTVKIMSTFKKHKAYLNKGEVTFEVFKFSPDNMKIVAKKSFTMLGEKVEGLVPIEAGGNLKETHENAKFIQRRLKFHDDITPKFAVISEKHGGGVFF